jgi:hypothetical protein
LGGGEAGDLAWGGTVGRKRHAGQADFVVEIDGIRVAAVFAVPLARGTELDAGAGL